MLTILRLALFILSNLGIWELLRSRYKIHVCFVPGLTVALQGSFLILGGILNILRETAYAVFLAGIVCLIFTIWKSRGVSFLKYYKHPAYLMLIVFSVVLLIWLQGHIFIHYDNFSHWALVVRQMLQTNQFPTFQSILIEFRDYPLASSSFLYYAAKIVSAQESYLMFAQAYAVLCFIMPVFLWARKHTAAVCITGMAVTYFLLVYNIPVTDLLVDTLLPVSAMSAFLYAWQYGRAVQGRASFIMIGVYMIWITQVKTAGIFFAVFMIVGILLCIRKDRHILLRIAVSLMPVLGIILWKRHCSYVFLSEMGSKHVLSASYYADTFGSKNPEAVGTIGRGLLQFSVTFTDVWIIFGILVITGILVFVFIRKERRNYGKFLGFLVLLYVTFQLALLGMYLFSMPEAEALQLAEIERYTRCILSAVVYLFAAWVMKLVSETICSAVSAYIISAAAVLALGGTLLATQGEIKGLADPIPGTSERMWLEKASEEYQVPQGASYVIFPKEEDGAYSYYLGKYIFSSPQVQDLYIEKEKDLEAVEGQYLFLFDDTNQMIRDWVDENYPEQAGLPVINREK